MHYDRAYRLLSILCLLFGAASTAGAAQLASIAHVPWAEMLAWVGLSLFGGLAYTIQRLDAERKAGTLTPPVLPGVLSDLMAGIVVGVITTSIGAVRELSAWEMLAPLLIAGYAGTRLLQKVAGEFIEQAAAKVSAVFGSKPGGKDPG